MKKKNNNLKQPFFVCVCVRLLFIYLFIYIYIKEIHYLEEP
jgi:hypothetical protein